MKPIESLPPLGQHIRRYRKANRWTLSAFAKQHGLSKSYLWELEGGSLTNPTLEVMMKIAAATETTLARVATLAAAALRSKQPAASDCDRDRDTGRRRAAVEILLATGWQWQEGKWQPAASEGDVSVPRDWYFRAQEFIARFTSGNSIPRDARAVAVHAGPAIAQEATWLRDRLAAYNPNTSKQAAGEAVATDECGRPLTYWGGKAPPRHPADEELSKSDKDYILRTQNLLLGFMLDCNAIGAKEAGVNLARSMKEKAALQAGTP